MEKSDLNLTVAVMVKAIECKRKMVARNLTIAKAHCPACSGQNTLFIRLHRNRRDPSGFHAHFQCKECKIGGME